MIRPTPSSDQSQSHKLIPWMRVPPTLTVPPCSINFHSWMSPRVIDSPLQGLPEEAEPELSKTCLSLAIQRTWMVTRLAFFIPMVTSTLTGPLSPSGMRVFI